MHIGSSDSDDQVLLELGKRIVQVRIDSELSQLELAEKAGIAKRTLERMESGLQVQVRSLIRILRCLGLLENLDLVIPEMEVRPMQVLEGMTKPRKRVSARKKQRYPAGSWKWGDEQ